MSQPDEASQPVARVFDGLHLPDDLAEGLDDDEDDDFEDEDDDLDDDDDMDEVAKARLDAALAQIDAMFGRPPSEQVAPFTDAHQALQVTLNRIDAD